jgi:hypothetical protein
VPTTKETISYQIKEFNQSKKYVIIHTNKMSWHLNDVVINEDNQTISGTLGLISSQHQYKKALETKRVHNYNKSKSDPLNEVHFYLKTVTDYKNMDFVSIPLAEIESITINDKNTGRAIANALLGTVGALFVVLLILAATKSSCPFVYIKNGETFDFAGELYPGTITPNMQRDDYLPLPNFIPENGEYALKISNKLKEIQYTDFVQLVIANHDKDIEVLMDSKGNLQTFKNIESPLNVTQDNLIKNRDLALLKDNEFYAFDTSIKTESSSRQIVFEFNKPSQSREAKLYLTAKNSVWLDYIFGKFNEQFGTYYNTFQKKQQEVHSDTINKWKSEQHIPLSVYLKVNDRWKLIEQVNSVGPMAMRDIVVPLNLEGVSGEKLQIKLETGFMFWEVDYVGVDFSKNLDLKPVYVNPSSAFDQNGNNVTHLLDKIDSRYFSQPNIDDEVTINFPVGEFQEGMVQSVFLKNRGYYNYVRDYKGIPDFEVLKSFRKKEAFTKYSEKSYLEFAMFDPNELSYHE